MTKRQVTAAMKANGIVGEIRGTGVSWEVELPTKVAMRRFCKLITNVGGYMTGHGAWVLRPDYRGNGDWNDKASRHHY
jgi:hypothetical protein